VSGCSRCIIMSRLEAPAARMLCARRASGRRRLITARGHGDGENRASGERCTTRTAFGANECSTTRMHSCMNAGKAAIAALDCCANRIACAIVVPAVARSSARSVPAAAARACVRTYTCIAPSSITAYTYGRCTKGENSAFECTCVRAWESTACLSLTSNSNSKPKFMLRL
jgi:hypothetical protein